ncbi:MAG: YggT family protein [Clostridiales Family XIII bacterium]|nr:YggT family protein [Clostridiales Family XIII bacterium]
MFSLAGILIWIVNVVLQLLSLSLVVRAVLSWFVYSGALRAPNILKLYNVLTAVTEPIVKPFRKLLGGVGSSGVDFAPLLALLAIYVVRRLLVSGLLFLLA